MNTTGVWYVFLAYGRSLYCTDIQVFGGKLVKNSCTCFWVPFLWFSPVFSVRYTLGIIVRRYLKTSQVSQVRPIFAYRWSWIFFVAGQLIASWYFQQRSWFGEKSVPQTACLSLESINTQQSLCLGRRATYREGLIDVIKNLYNAEFRQRWLSQSSCK